MSVCLSFNFNRCSEASYWSGEGLKQFWGRYLNSSKKHKKDYTFLMLPGILILLLSILWGILLGIHQIGTFIEMKKVLKDKSYLTVEGIVVNQT